MADLSLGGVLSGIDYDTLVAASLTASYKPLLRAQESQDLYESKVSAVRKIRSAFTTFQTRIGTLTDTSTIAQVKAKSIDTDVLDISAAADASEGSHTITVNRLATSHRLVHDAGLANLYTQVGNGGSVSTTDNDNTVADSAATWFTPTTDTTYEFAWGDETFEVTFNSGETYSMDDVAAAIDSAAGYDAASVTGAGPYTLQMTSKYETSDTLVVARMDGDAISVLESDQYTNNLDGADPSDGVFSYSYNGTTRNLATSAETTLEDLRDLINDDGSNPGVTASIIQHNNAYHLVLAGQNTGSDYQITIDSTETTIDTFDNDASQWTESQQALDAQFRVDGYPTEASGEWMTSSSNTVTGAIPSVTLTLNGTGETTVTTTTDTSTVKTRVRQMIQQYNTVYGTVDLYTGYDSATKTSGVLQGDSTVTSLLTPIRSMMTGGLAGFERDTDGFEMLAEIGIEIDSDGEFSLDDDVFDAALEDNYEQVIQFIGADGRGRSDNSYVRFNSALDSTERGNYEVKAEFTGSTLTAGYVRVKGETTWREADIDASSNTITGKDGNDEAGLAVTVVHDGSSSEMTAEVALQDGFANAIDGLLETILDSDEGSLAIQKDSYEDAIDDLDDRIESLEARIDRKRTALEAKFSRLEATLAQLGSMTSQFEAMFSQLNAMEAAKE
ncbi:MAG: flagellar filament capping protein FliD [Planctomycetes bacterium]|nr:flagellar filament capping protein FliD [Planctomycetota bacterium]